MVALAPIDDFIGRLAKVKQSAPNQWLAICPAHPDRSPSLSISTGTDGKILVSCHAGCDFQSIADAVEMPKGDFFVEGTGEREVTRRRVKATYDYLDEDGTLLFQVVRYEPKEFRQRTPDGRGGWEWAASGTKRVPYRLPRVLDAISKGIDIFIVEGEADVEAMEAEGYVATTNPGGAGKWLESFNRYFAGANVHVISDRDTPGRKHAMDVIEGIRGVTASEVRWFEPPAPFKDVRQLLSSGRGIDELTRVEEAVVREEAMDRDAVEGQLSQVGDAIKRLARDRDISAGDAILSARDLVGGLQLPRSEVDGLWSSDELIETPDEPYDWVIPGVLERGDRVVLVGSEGSGKSYYAIQIAALSAQGINPFWFTSMAPIRTLMVDLENPPKNMRRSLDKIVGQARTHAGNRYERDRFNIWLQPGGINLVGKDDVRKLHEVIERTTPDLICLGPVYKSFIEKSDKREEQMRAVLAVLDEIRTKYGCCLWIEHHAPKASGNNPRSYVPYGSSYWLRWPEFGLAMMPDMTSPLNEADGPLKAIVLGRWRGDRDQRTWPKSLVWGTQFAWVPTEIERDGILNRD